MAIGDGLDSIRPGLLNNKAISVKELHRIILNEPFEVTADHLIAISGVKKPKLLTLFPDFVMHLNDICPQFGIDTEQEFAHFLAQACHETDHFNTLVEYASGKAYEGRKDLGNVVAGDGVRFKGRGVFQTTGRANYKQLGELRNAPLMFVNNPVLLEQPKDAIWSACVYWDTRNLNDTSNMPDSTRLKPVEYIGLVINGGFNGMDQRKEFYQRARQAFNI